MAAYSTVRRARIFLDPMKWKLAQLLLQGFHAQLRFLNTAEPKGSKYHSDTYIDPKVVI